MIVKSNVENAYMRASSVYHIIASKNHFYIIHPPLASMHILPYRLSLNADQKKIV